MDQVIEIRPQSTNAAAWCFLAFLSLCLLAIEIIDPVPITLSGLVPLTIACTTLWSVAYYYRHISPCEKFAEMCVSLSHVLLFSGVGVALSYLAARTANPLWDLQLAEWDRQLGFDWMAMMRTVDQSPIATATMVYAYPSLIPQIVVLVCALGFMARLTVLRTVMLAAMLCGGICILISAFMPAVAYPVHMGLKPDEFDHLVPWPGYMKMGDFNALREGTIEQLDFTAMHGLITFPSYHAGLSAVTLWGFWQSRVSWVRWPGVVLASLTIIATPVIGGHYLVDVIAGVAIAIACLFVARKAIYWSPSFDLVTALPFRRLRVAPVQ